MSAGNKHTVRVAPERGETGDRPSAPIRRKLGAAFGAVSLVLLVGIVSLIAVWQLVSAFTETARTTHIATELRQVVGGFSDAESGLRGYILTGQDRYLAQYQDAQRDTRVELEHLVADMARYPELRESASRFAAATEQSIAAMDTLGFVAVTEGRDQAAALLAAGLTQVQMDSVRAAMRDVARLKQQQMERSARERDRNTWVAVAVIAGGGLVAFLLLVIVLVAVRREILHEARLQGHLLEQTQRLDEQATELELQNEQLQDQAVALEEQSSKLEAQQTQLEAANEELLRANAEIETSRERLRLLLESAEIGMYGLDADGSCSFVNPAATRMLGYKPDELIGERLHDRIHYAHADGSPYPFEECTIRRALVKGERVRSDKEVYWRKDGSRLSVDYTAAPLTGGGTVVSFLDITARKRDEEVRTFLADATTALNSSLDYEATLKAVAEQAVPRLGDWCVVDVLEDGQLRRLAIVHRDPERLRLVQELSRRRPPRLDSPAGSGHVIATGRSQLIPEIPEELLVASAEGDVEVIKRLDQLQLQSLLAVPLKARNRPVGAIVCVMAESGRRFGEQDLEIAEDLAARASLAIENALLFKEAEEARQRAEAADRTKSQFLAAMSHELRTPLNAIAGYAELIAVGVHGPVTDKQRESLERITRSQKTLLSLINDVLNFSKLQAGYVQVGSEEVEIGEVVTSLEELVEPLLRAKGLEYVCEACPDYVTVRGDREKIQQVLLNLLSNAVKFTPQGGRVTLTCEFDSSEVRVAVSDTGPGIPAEKVEEIFEPFVQVDRGVQSTYQGTGLGLAISRDLARAMNGNLAVADTSNRGSTFVLTLPRADAAKPRASG